MINKTFLDAVTNYSDNMPVRFHMPGHKGLPVNKYQNDLLKYDLTELKDTDNIYDPQKNGVVKNLFAYLKKVYNTENTVISAGGATLCIQTAVLSAIRLTNSKKIICERKCHKSVVNAVCLCGAEPVWINITDDKYEYLKKIIDITEAAALIITSPDYYGKMHDVKKIAEICHNKRILLICDNSHGSHLAFYNNGILHPYNNNADIVIDSLHKTLPALTGAALLHANEKFDEELLLASLRIFASTSPSYLISASIQACVEYMVNNGYDKLVKLYDKINDVKNILSDLGYKINKYYIEDPFRICINTNNAEKLYDYLYSNNIVCEFSDDSNVILMPSVMNGDVDFNLLIEYCKAYHPDKKNTDIDVKKTHNYIIPEKKYDVSKTILYMTETVDIDEALNRPSGGIYALYPPGIPIIIPGEIFDTAIIQILKKLGYTELKIMKE